MTQTKKDSSTLLQSLRCLMKSCTLPIQAYIINSENAHFTEYTSDYDARLDFFSNFSGKGVAVVTEKKAALWTDGRYFLQASMEMDSNWHLINTNEHKSVTLIQWIKNELSAGSHVGVDPFLISHDSWEEMSKGLGEKKVKLVEVKENLVDKIWTGRPPMPSAPIYPHPLPFSGEKFESKVKKVREKMEEEGCVAQVVSGLDEVAWILNLRGSEIKFNPLFYAYLIITRHNLFFFVDEKKLTEEAKEHLNLNKKDKKKEKKEDDDESGGVILRDYGEVVEGLKQIISQTNNQTPNLIWISPLSNQGLFNIIPQDRLKVKYSFIKELKCVKNDTEIKGMVACHIRDSAALCEFYYWLENEVKVKGQKVTEIQAANKLESIKSKLDNFVESSFETISASEANGALYNYSASKKGMKCITKSGIYFIDSGAHYRDGTTDCTRVLHFSEPSPYERECFTLVLKGHIALASLVFPNNVKGSCLDCFSRQFLWSRGLDFKHGTGHGVGSFLSVVEGPIGFSSTPEKDEIPLKRGMILSNEPGYYEEGKFGLRIENLMLVTEVHTKNNFEKVGFLKLEPLAFVPLQSKLINKEMLTQNEIKWVNEYHKMCWEKLSIVLETRSLYYVVEWLKEQTQPL